MTAAIRTIVHRIHDIDEPRASFIKIHQSFKIDKNNLCEVKNRYILKAHAKPVLVWRTIINADASAEPMNSLDEINFKITVCCPENRNEVRYLLFNNQDRKKEIAVFFLPEISPGDTREVEISYSWPGGANDLLKNGSTTFDHAFKSVEKGDLAELKYEFQFAESLGPLTFEELGSKSKLLSYTEPTGSKPYYHCTYNNPAGEVGSQNKRFAVRKRLL